MLTVAVVAAWITVCLGGSIESEHIGIACQFGGPCSWVASQHWEHGWPWVFVTRDTDYGSSHRFAWSDGMTTFDATALAFDAAVLVAGLAALAGGIWWFDRRLRSPRGWTVSLRAVLAVMLLVAAIGSYAASWGAFGAEQTRIAQALEADGHEAWLSGTSPRWLKRLLGTSRSIHLAPVVTSVRLIHTEEHDADRDPFREQSPRPAVIRDERTSGDRLLDRWGKSLAQLGHLEDLNLEELDITDAGLHRLLTRRTTWPWRIVSLRANRNVTGQPFLHTRLPNLRSVNASQTQLEDAAVEAFTRSPDFAILTAYETQLTYRSVFIAEKTPSLQVFDVDDTMIEDVDLVELRARGVECSAKGQR